MIDSTKINEVPGNLFDYDKEYALVHCVDAGFTFNAGLAKFFQVKYSTRDELRQAFPHYHWTGHGECLITNDGNIFNLVTKNGYYDKPTLENLKEALVDLKEKCKAIGVSKIAMPRLGCGYDGLYWSDVRNAIDEVFLGEIFDVRIVYLHEAIHGTIIEPELPQKKDELLSKKFY